MERIEFEWDDEKEQKNLMKHGIDFSTAAHVFADVCRLEKYDGHCAKLILGFLGIAKHRDC